MALNPIDLEVIWNRLIFIAEEQGKALYQGSFSTIIGEAEDFASAIFDAKGNLLAQAQQNGGGTPAMLIGMARGVKEILRKFPASNLVPGDCIICNDPWLLSGHQPDITVIAPVFYQGIIVAFTGTSAHVADMGGRGFSADCRDCFEEALLIPPVKLFNGNIPNTVVFDFIESNVRVPDQVRGDLLAQASANKIGGKKIEDLLEEFGLENLFTVSEDIFQSSEQALLQAISNIPQGEYQKEVRLDGFDRELKIIATVRIRKSGLEVDFEGTSPQIDRGINCTLNVSYAYVSHAVKSALVPEIPNNEGIFRPLRILAPEGSLLNPRRPAPVMSRDVVYTFISAAVYGALSQAVPSRVIADSGSKAVTQIRGVNLQGKAFIYTFQVRCGMGARPTLDGLSGTNYPGNVGSVPVEIIETVSPIFMVKKEFVPDSGGPGKFRGGCDHEMTFRVRGDRPALISCRFERIHHPAKGFLGGGDGSCGRVILNGNAPLHAKKMYTLEPGDEITVSGGGGGGFFPAVERAPELVLRDVIDGLVTVEQAERDYKVSMREYNDFKAH